MARKALGRGLGSLIPTQESDVPRETSLAPESAMDVFFPRHAATGDSVNRSTHASVTADLLKPPARNRAKAKSEAGKKKTVDVSVTGQPQSNPEVVDLVPVPGARMAYLRVAEIAPNLDQPREQFDPELLTELSESIKEIGVLQPIVVREVVKNSARFKALTEARKATDDGNENAEIKYELIMGERRLRASKLAGLTEIPAIIRDTQDDDMLRDALLENLHRAQLNPIEEAAAYQQLLEEFGCTQEELSKRIKRSRPQISNTMRLLKLPHAVQLLVMENLLSMGHARALLSLEDSALIETVAHRIIDEGLSVRATEELVAKGGKATANAKASKDVRPLSIQGTFIQERLSDLLGAKVTVDQRKRTGKIVVEFGGADDLERIAALVSVLKLGGHQ
ncbi:ParB-like protein [Gleimia coleocanis DSM 15436]|uniref:ParB-like protein n=1 Tax=Gleimia coleocanis DSM 15436 TaxID=525245 RepID=C0VXZ5_9ACTO|nr:ParB/RepB/Spo0J family partition protein [Gleimia coleocanis]EEH64298.1 ParB-like protein [Gleimia coleocanis DSM 15436]